MASPAYVSRLSEIRPLFESRPRSRFRASRMKDYGLAGRFRAYNILFTPLGLLPYGGGRVDSRRLGVGFAVCGGNGLRSTRGEG